MTTKSYNGWTNYETWNVKLWIDNDQGSQEYWAEQATNHLERDEDCAVDVLAATLKEEHTQALPDVTGFAADLLNAAMSEVNWREIARELVETAKQEANA